MSAIRRRAGYTLIELLVAITLASLVAVLGAVVMRAAMDFDGRARRHLTQSEDLRAADRLLVRDWSRRREQDLVATASQLEFRSDRLYGMGVEGAAKVRYLCTENEAGQFALERQLLALQTDQPRSGGAGPGTTANGWRVLHAEVLVARLAGCSFAYLRTRESNRIAEWRADIAPGQTVPRLLRLSLATERGEIAPLVYGVES